MVPPKVLETDTELVSNSARPKGSPKELQLSASLMAVAIESGHCLEMMMDTGSVPKYRWVSDPAIRQLLAQQTAEKSETRLGQM